MQSPYQAIEALLSNSVPNKPTMGQGEYKAQPGQPLGWDYDTLMTVMDEMGLGEQTKTMDDSVIDQMLQMLEQQGAPNNDAAMQLIGKQFGGKLGGGF